MPKSAIAELTEKRRTTYRTVQQSAAAAQAALAQAQATATVTTSAPALAADPLQAEAARLKAQIEAAVQTAYEEWSSQPREEVAEPDGWWNLYAVGPVQFFSPGSPLPPHQVIKVGETAFVATVLILNPAPILPPGMSPLDVLSNFALPFQVRYQTGNLTTWTLGSAALNQTQGGGLVPGVGFYVDVLGFVADQPGLFEMNISARLLGAAPPFINAPQFAGYARQVVDFDGDTLFGFGPNIGTPGFQFDQPIRFQVYP
jgi:hypothetical protein